MRQTAGGYAVDHIMKKIYSNQPAATSVRYIKGVMNYKNSMLKEQ